MEGAAFGGTNGAVEIQRSRRKSLQACPLLNSAGSVLRTPIFLPYKSPVAPEHDSALCGRHTPTGNPTSHAALLYHVCRVALQLTRLCIWLLLGWACAAQAQGQGSYGGLAASFALLALIGILIVTAFVLFGVRLLFGTRAAFISALSLVAITGAGLAYFFVNSSIDQSKRHEAHKKAMHAFAVGCAETTRRIESPAIGDERIYIRLHGADKVPEYLRSGLLPSKNNLAEGVEVVTTVPTGGTRAIVIDISYDRELLPGAYPGYGWERTKYELTATAVPDGRVIAHTMDMQARNGFCLDGDLEEFLQEALNRPSVLSRNESGMAKPIGTRVPHQYVQAKYLETTTGVYLKSTAFRDSKLDIKEVFRSNGCRIQGSSISPEVAQCGDASQGSAEVPLYNIIGINRFSDTWLLTYQVYKGGWEGLSSVRVEQRLANWQLARVWRANAAPYSGDFQGGFYVAEFSLDGEAMIASVYLGKQWTLGSTENWFTGKSALRVPLPGLTR